MICSYAAPGDTDLYLSLIGFLNNGTAMDVVAEYRDRRRPWLRRVILDLGCADGADSCGLELLPRLANVAGGDSVSVVVVAQGSPAEARILEKARGHGIRSAVRGGLGTASLGLQSINGSVRARVPGSGWHASTRGAGQ